MRANSIETNSTVRLVDVSIGYKQGRNSKVIASHLNGTLNNGDFVCLLGPNGAGKSTLLRSLAAFQPLLNGEISLFDRSLESYSPSELAKSVGVVLTSHEPLTGLTVREVVGLGRTPYTDFWGSLNDDDRQQVEHAMSLVGINGLGDRDIESLSDGERQKTMIAKALAQQTSIILLDEPTAFLDFPSKIEVMLLLAQLAHEQHKTILLSTHDVELALQLADSLWLIDSPHGMTIGSPDTLSTNGDIERYFHHTGIHFDSEHKRFIIE